jgi:MHS family proline/betaine transporter-like MFS transporter
MATLLIGMTQSKLAPGWYLVAAAAVSLTAVLFAAETSRKPLKHL